MAQTQAGAQKLLDRLHGEPIRWFQAMGDCPCKDPTTGRWDKTHALCGGTGTLKREADVTGYRAIVTSVMSSRNFTEVGELAAGDLLCSTWPDQIPLADDDEVIVPSRSRQDSVTITRSANSGDVIPDVEYVVGIEQVFGQDGPIEAGYSLDVDQSTGVSQIVWQATQGPGIGVRYRVRYRYTPRWEVITSPVLDRRPDPGGQRLPQRVGLKLINKVR